MIDWAQPDGDRAEGVVWIRRGLLFDRFRPGDKIVVGVEPGALGIPWFYGVYRQ